MTNEEKVIEIDEFLRGCEDWMHGEDSKTVTRCRKLLFQLNDELSKLHQPTVISTVRCDHIFLRQDSMWMKCAKCGMIQPISTGL